MKRSDKLFGVTGLFKTPNEIVSAAKKIKEAGFKKFDVNTPYPVHGMDKAMGLKPTKLGFVTLIFGLSGTAFILFFMWWAGSIDYPVVIGGKPLFALPAFIPIAFEFTVLLAALSTVFGMLIFFFNLPANSYPLHDTNYMKAVSNDKYGIVILAEDPLFNEEQVKQLFISLNAENIESVYEFEKVNYQIFNPKFIMFLAFVAILTSGATYFTLNKLMFMTPFTWMNIQEKNLPEARNTFFADSYSMRKPVEGTVARGFIPYAYKGQTDPGPDLINPLVPTKSVLELGRRKFLTYCSPCHGNNADGDSRLHGQFPNPPTLHSDRARNFSDGKIYHIITNGQNIMPSYESQITRRERWAIVTYIRALQRAKNASEADLSRAK